MSSEDIRFEIANNKFNTIIAAYEPDDNSNKRYNNADEAIPLIENRRMEIMDFVVRDSKKYNALDRLLNETSRIFPNSQNALHCEIIIPMIKFAAKSQQDDLLRLAKIVHMHRHGLENNYFISKIMYDIYDKLTVANKKDFPYKNELRDYQTVVTYNKLWPYRNQMDKSTSIDEIDPLVDEAIKLIRDKEMGAKNATELRLRIYTYALNKCSQLEPHRKDSIKYYQDKIKKTQQRLEYITGKNPPRNGGGRRF